MTSTRRHFLQAAALSVAGFSLTNMGAKAAAALPKGRIKQSFTWGTFGRKGIAPEQLIKEAAAIGYASIEMGPREHWSRIREAGLAIAIFGGHRSLTDGMNEPKNHDRIEKELLASIELAVQYQVPGLICFSGNRRGISDEAGLENCAACVKRVIKVAEEKKVVLCMELLNSKVNHPDYQCDHSWWGVELCKRVNSPSIKLLYDIYHMQIMEGDLIRTIQNNIQYIGHFHTAGNPGRRDLDDTQEVYYPAVMRAIAATDYKGYVGHEFSPKGDPMEAMKQTFKLCDV
jgi:hydroxypyruvate isomerase